MADLLPMILGFEFTDDKFLGNYRFIFCFNKARNMLLKRNKTRRFHMRSEGGKTPPFSSVLILGGIPEGGQICFSRSLDLSICSVEEMPV